eukprot:1926326-Karenia_brevis.AAC.1
MPEQLPDLHSTLAYGAVVCTESDTDSQEELEGALNLTESEIWAGATSQNYLDREVVYTDGACTNNQDANFRRAGGGGLLVSQ